MPWNGAAGAGTGAAAGVAGTGTAAGVVVAGAGVVPAAAVVFFVVALGAGEVADVLVPVCGVVARGALVEGPIGGPVTLMFADASRPLASPVMTAEPAETPLTIPAASTLATAELLELYFVRTPITRVRT